ncbi:GNAT family N-acetyltransferase [Pseudoroseicyclus sp. H15]
MGNILRKAGRQGEPIEVVVLGKGDLRLLMSAPEDLFDEEVRPDEAKAFLKDPANLMVMALERGVPVGFASGTMLRHPDKAPSFFVNEVGVMESHQRRGIGRTLMERVKEVARERGAEGIWVGTEMDNDPARGLYRALGGDEMIAALYGWDGALDS